MSDRRRRNECRPVELPDGQVVIVRGNRELDAAGVAAVSEIVAAAQRHHELLHPQDPAAAGLYARLDAARIALDVTWRELARQTGAPASVLTRLAQGVVPTEPTLGALEAWLARNTGASGVDSSAGTCN